VSEVVDETRIGVELILPAGVRAGPPVFAFAFVLLHGKEPEFACANALNELVEYVRALEDRPTIPPGVAVPPVNGPAAVTSKPRPILLRLMKGRFATEEGSKSGIRVGSEACLGGGADADLEVEGSEAEEDEGFEEVDTPGVVEVGFPEVDGEGVAVRVRAGADSGWDGWLLVEGVAAELFFVVTGDVVFDFVKLDATLLRRRKAAAAAAAWGDVVWAEADAPSTGDGWTAVAVAVSDDEALAVPTTVGVAVPAEPASSSEACTSEVAALLDDSATEVPPASPSGLGTCQVCHSPPTLKPWNALGATTPAGDRERAVECGAAAAPPLFRAPAAPAGG